jgi:hypothetical protein
MEIEVEFGRKGTTPRLDTYHLHPRCLAAWEFVRDTLEGDPDALRPIDAVGSPAIVTEARGAAETAAD